MTRVKPRIRREWRPDTGRFVWAADPKPFNTWGRTDTDQLRLWQKAWPWCHAMNTKKGTEQAQGVGPTDTLLAALIAIESAFAQKCADTWCTSRNAETLETARAAIAAAGGKVSRNTEPER